jgi:predicted Zn-dependent peptidase
MANYKKSKLSNGLTIITSEDPNSEIVTMEIAVRAGSKYEKKGERGYAHLLEHILARGGSSKISSNKDLITDRSGATFSAYTNAEVICIFSQVVTEKAELISKLIIDALINPAINKKSLENEKSVVLEEFKKSLDKKEGYLWMKTAENVFGENRLANYPIGKEEDIIHADVKTVKDYHKKFFNPEETIFICIGNMDHKKICEIIEKETKKWKSSADNKKNIDENEVILLSGKENKNNIIPIQGLSNYVSVNILAEKPSLKELLGLDIIANYLGYRRTSLLYRELRQKSGLIYSVSVSNMSFRGASLLYVITASASYKKVVSIIKEKLLRIDKYFSKKIFEEYKKQVINVLKRDINDPLKKKDLMKKGWILYGKFISPDDFVKEINSVSYKDIKNVIKKYFKKERLFITVLEKK